MDEFPFLNSSCTPITLSHSPKTDVVESAASEMEEKIINKTFRHAHNVCNEKSASAQGFTLLGTRCVDGEDRQSEQQNNKHTVVRSTPVENKAMRIYANKIYKTDFYCDGNIICLRPFWLLFLLSFHSLCD